jgi:NADH-quinone oxidoreductase subunit M
MINSELWLALLLLIPAGALIGAAVVCDAPRLRRTAAGCAALLVLVSLLPILSPELRNFEVHFPDALTPYLGPVALRMSLLGMFLVPLTACLWLITVAVMPRSLITRGSIGRTATATMVTMASFLSTSPLTLMVLWGVSVAVFLAAHRGAAHRRVRWMLATYHLASTVLFSCGATLVSFPRWRGTWAEELGLWLVIVAILIRKGIFPFHAWVPEVCDRGRLGPAVLFSAPQIASYVTAVIIVPRASPAALQTIAILALITAVHGSALALFQRDARRACGYLFVSQSALVLAGLDCASNMALGGALLYWISSALAFAGVARCVLVLEARRGRLDLRTHHGGYERMPMLAISFLLLGLACAGFPGTLGFIGGEMLVDGAVTAFPVLGFCVVGTNALTGLAVLRMYFSLFCGRRDEGAHVRLLRRESITFSSIALLLLVGGLVPGPMVKVGLRASVELLQGRRVIPGALRPSTERDASGR